MIRLDPATFVSGQITPAEVAEAAAAGVKTIINNRPDGEEPGQPTSADIAAAAKAAGLAYHHIPVSRGFSHTEVEAMAEALENGPVLAFCRSGTRSTYLWALARTRGGEDPATLIERGRAVGYDLRSLTSYLGSLS